MSWAVIVGALVAAGCGGGEGDTNDPIVVTLSPEAGTEDLWNVTLDFGGGSEEACREMPATAVAEVNGVTLQFTSRGGRHWQSVGIAGRRLECEAVTADGQVHASGDGIDRIRIQDGAREVLSVDVANLFGERSVRWVEPADGVLRAGARAILEWSPATDTVHFPFSDSSTPLQFEVTEGPEVVPTWSGPFTWDGPQVSFSVASWSADSSVPSHGWVTVVPSFVNPSVVSVSGQYGHAQVVIDGALIWNPRVAYTYAP